MKDLWAKTVLHKLAITRFVLFVIGTLCGSIQASLAGAEWSGLSGQQKFMIVIGIVGATCATIAAFFDKTLSRISEGKNPFTTETIQPFEKK